ncbi:hypothetical protein JW868_04860 [Candidatus Woesearchaeota archaeon]|nr:hypothetical protein [Candidatus Woesearchaeota archaeon]
MQKYTEHKRKKYFTHDGKQYSFEIMETLPEIPPCPENTTTSQNIITLNTQKNVQIFIRQFSKYAQNLFLTIIFVNPSANQKWLIKPHVHNLVADKTSLKRGIMALSENVLQV